MRYFVHEFCLSYKYSFIESSKFERFHTLKNVMNIIIKSYFTSPFLELKHSFTVSLRCASSYNITVVNVWLNVSFIELYPMLFI